MGAKQLVRQMLIGLPEPVGRTIERAAMTLRSPISPWHRIRRSILRKMGAPRYQVRQGPFRSMRYPPLLSVSVLPKLLGTYEIELQPVVEDLFRANTDLIVNIGAAEGYYAIGFARHRPQTKIVCFEMSEQIRQDLRRMMRANGVTGQIEIYGRCTPENLAPVLEQARQPAVICDVEGYEDELLDPGRIPKLMNAIILVELHEHERSGLTDRIRQRFQGSHDIRSIWSRERRREDLPEGCDALTDSELRTATDEYRVTQQQWFYMTPRTGEQH